MLQACKNNDISTVIRLLNNYKDDDADNDYDDSTYINYNDANDYDNNHYEVYTSPLLIACLEGYIDLVKILLEHPYIDVNKVNGFDKTSLHIACDKQYLEIIVLLLSHPSIDVNAQDCNKSTPFNNACISNHIDVVKILLEDSRVDVNLPNETEYGGGGWWSSYRMEIYSPLQNACNNSHQEIVNLLLNDSRTELNRVDKNYNETAFYIACTKDNENIVITMLENYKIDITISDSEGYNVFHKACELDKVYLVKLLINHSNINLNAVTKHGKTAFALACEKFNEEIIKILLEDYRIDKNIADNFGDTAFHSLCKSAKFKLIQLLLNDTNNDIDVDTMNESQKTPFYNICWVASTYLEEITKKSSIFIDSRNEAIILVKYMLEDTRINIHQKDKNGITILEKVLEMANKNNDQLLMDLLT